MSYRDRLYANYSANFGTKKEFALELQCAIYERTYSLQSIHKAAAIADLGCGKGEWLAWLHEKGFENLTGIDVAASEVDFTAKKEITMITSDIVTALQEKRETFGLLHAKDVLEHMTKDEAVEFLEACLSALKPGGELWILTFNAQSPLASTTRYGDFTHELGVTPTSLAQVLRATGFEINKIRGYFPQSGSTKGKIRAFLFSIVEKAASFLLKLRHGAGKTDPLVETNSATTDLFAIARKPND